MTMLRAVYDVHPVLVDLYTNGWCPMMACALCSLDPDLEIVETDDDGETYHVAALAPDGGVWDVTGCQALDDFEAKWGPCHPLVNVGSEHEMIARGEWEALALFMTGGHPVLGPPPPIAWELTVDLARRVLTYQESLPL